MSAASAGCGAYPEAIAKYQKVAFSPPDTDPLIGEEFRKSVLGVRERALCGVSQVPKHRSTQA